MNLFGLSPGELLLIMMVALVVLGPEKLPETAASVGKWIREFRRATEELTAQFAAENPLAELQRAFSLTDEPVSVETVEEPTVVEEPAALADPAGVGVPMIAPPSASLSEVPVRRRSDYFDRPVYSPGIATMWTHGAIEERRPGRRRRSGDAEPSIASEWMHGAPLPISPSSNGHNGHALSTNGSSALTSTLIASDASVEPDLTSSTAEATFGSERAESVSSAPVVGIGGALYRLDPASGDESGDVQQGEHPVELEKRFSEEEESAPGGTDQELTTFSTINGDGREGQRA